MLVLAGDVATLIYGYHHHHHQAAAGESEGEFLTQLVWGGAILCSTLPLLALCRLLPERAKFLCGVWHAVHFTWSDDLARHALHVLYDLQARPAVDTLRLSILFDVENLDYWWWCLQGLLLMALVGALSGGGSDDESEFASEASGELTEVVTGDGRGSHLAIPPTHHCLALPHAPPHSTLCVIREV